MLDVICIGRSSVDLYGDQVNGKLEDMSSFSKYVGGSPTNISIGCSRLGLKSALITRVGNEHMGRFVIEQLRREGVNVSNIKTDKDRLTALVLLGIKSQDQFPLIFFRENCADMALCEDDIEEDFIKISKSVLVTGTHFSTKTVSDASFKAMKIAKKFNKEVILDIDYRPNLWEMGKHNEGESRFKENLSVTNHIQNILSYCTLIVGTEEEWNIAGGQNDTLESMKVCRKISKAIFVCKRGSLGCTVFKDDISNWSNGITVPVREIEIFNVLGAGDGFMAGFLKGWLRGEELRKCSELANACGALAVSRHGCAPSYPSVEELNYFISFGSNEYSLRKDKKLEQIHWSTNRRIKYSQLFAFAFDHRKQFLNWAKKSNKTENDIDVFKTLALEVAVSLKKDFPNIGILVDDELGRSALQKASDYGMWIGRPIEVSGKYPLELTNEQNLTAYLSEWPINHCVKVLAPMRMDDNLELKIQNENKILSLYNACRNTNHEFLLEIITGYSEKNTDPEQIVELIKRFYELGIFPDWWKIEPVKDKNFWKMTCEFVNSNDPYTNGVVVLGKDTDQEHMIDVFNATQKEKLIKGFAIGRTIFSEAAKKWLNDEISNDYAKDIMSNKLKKLIKIWENSRN